MRVSLTIVLLATVVLPTAAHAGRGDGANISGAPSSSSLEQRRDRPLPARGVLIAQSEEPKPLPAPTGDAPAQTTDEDGLLERAKRAVQDAGRNVGEAATAAGRSAADYLSDNPDLNRQVLEFGKDLGLPGFDTTAAGGAQLAVTRAEGNLRVVASGLPGDKEVNLGWLDDDTFHALQTLTSDASGTIDTTITTPSALPSDQKVTLAIETLDRRLRLASDPIDPL